MQMLAALYSEGCQLTKITKTKALGMTIDEHLTWKSHIENDCKLSSRNLGVLNKVKHLLPQNSLYQLCCSFILPYLSCGIYTLLGNASTHYMAKILKLQKRALRVIILFMSIMDFVVLYLNGLRIT